MKENQRVVLTKRMLREGLLELLETKPLDKISVTELCRAAGINRATFYRHYQSPQEVLADVGRDISRQFQAEAPQYENAESVAVHLEALCEYLYRHADLMRVLLRSSLDGGLSWSIRQSYETILGNRQDLRIFGDLDDQDLLLLATFLGGGCHMLLSRWLQQEEPKDPKEVAALLYRIVRP